MLQHDLWPLTFDGGTYFGMSSNCRIWLLEKSLAIPEMHKYIKYLESLSTYKALDNDTN